MRILIVSNLYPPIVFGGYEILCEQVVERLRDRGHEVSFFSMTRPDNLPCQYLSCRRVCAL